MTKFTGIQLESVDHLWLEIIRRTTEQSESESESERERTSASLFALQVTFIPRVIIIKGSKFSHSDTEISLGLHFLKGNNPEHNGSKRLHQLCVCVCVCVQRGWREEKTDEDSLKYIFTSVQKLICIYGTETLL